MNLGIITIMILVINIIINKYSYVIFCDKKSSDLLDAC